MVALSDLSKTNKKQDPLTWYKQQKSLTWYEIRILTSFNRKKTCTNKFAQFTKAKQIDISDPASYVEVPSGNQGNFISLDILKADLKILVIGGISDNQTGTSTAEAPEYCSQCLYYEGNYLHCSVHPGGISKLSCPDFVRKTKKGNLDKENTFSSLLNMLDQ